MRRLEMPAEMGFKVILKHKFYQAIMTERFGHEVALALMDVYFI